MGFNWLPTIAEAGSALLGGYMNSAFQRKQLGEQVAAMKDLWSFQQKNAHQFEVEDLRAAGLNPILSATNSQIASMPGVSTPSSAPYSGLSNGIGNAITSGMKLELEKKKLDVELAKAKAETELIKNQTVESAWRSNLSAKQLEVMSRDLWEKVDLYDIRKKLLENQRDQAEAMIGQIDANVEKIGAETGLTRMQTALAEKSYRFGAYMSQFLPMAFCEEFEKDPKGTLIKWKNEIETVVKEKSDDLAPSALSAYEDIKKYIYGVHGRFENIKLDLGVNDRTGGYFGQ